MIQERPSNRIAVPRQEAKSAYRRPVICTSKLEDVGMEFRWDRCEGCHFVFGD